MRADTTHRISITMYGLLPFSFYSSFCFLLLTLLLMLALLSISFTMPHNSRQDKPSQRDNSCSVSGTDLRDPRESRSAASAQQLLCWHKPEKPSGHVCKLPLWTQRRLLYFEQAPSETLRGLWSVWSPTNKENGAQSMHLPCRGSIWQTKSTLLPKFKMLWGTLLPSWLSLWMMKMKMNHFLVFKKILGKDIETKFYLWSNSKQQ